MNLKNKGFATSTFPPQKITYNQTQMTILQGFISFHKSKQQFFDQLNLIKQQNQILNQIKSKININSIPKSYINPINQQASTDIEPIKIKTSRTNSIIIDDINFLTQSKLSLPCDSDYQQHELFQMNPQQNSILLKQINQKCGQQMECWIKNIIEQGRRLRKRLKKYKKYEQMFERANRQNIQVKGRHEQQVKLIKRLQDRIKGMQDEKKKLNKINGQRQRSMIKKQMSLLVKQRILNEKWKNINKKIQGLNIKKSQIQKQRINTQQIWLNILNAIQPQNQFSFKNNVFLKCKQSLANQRKILLQQQSQLQAHYQFLQKILSQFKTI